MLLLLLLFEGVACYERHPWDARGKVGLERKFATSDTLAKSRQGSVGSRSWFLFKEFRPRGPQILVVSQGNLGEKDPYNAATILLFGL